jgi:hypothetical protein
MLSVLSQYNGDSGDCRAARVLHCSFGEKALQIFPMPPNGVVLGVDQPSTAVFMLPYPVRDMKYMSAMPKFGSSHGKPIQMSSIGSLYVVDVFLGEYSVLGSMVQYAIFERGTGVVGLCCSTWTESVLGW